MQLGFVGLGRMGLNMVRRLTRAGHELIGYDVGPEARARAASEGLRTASSLDEIVSVLQPPRAVWIMVPSGAPTESSIVALGERLSPGDVIIDGGNTNFHDDIRRAQSLRAHGIHHVDAGTSGGIWGLENGYCLMVGGDAAICQRLEPLFHALAPEDGYRRVGDHGAGHYVKMVHNGIEYGLMQAYAEGFALMQASPFELELDVIAALWLRGSVVRSWLLELAARALAQDPSLAHLSAYVDDSGEGRWMLNDAVERGIPLPTLAAALFTRFRSRDDNPFAERMLASLREQFGGHAVKPAASPVDSHVRSGR
jgi:6-phosphogluconate dehydrogenase